MADDGKVGVYVHVPFCERVCPYCDFAVEAARPLSAERERRYVDALLGELAVRAPVFADRPLVSLYLGGGTPSLLEPASLERIIEAVRRAFPAAGPVEVTLEVNPSTVERGRLPDFRRAGANRVSLGVQSFDDRVLQRLGRAHRADEARRTLDACREADFETLCLDLIFAAPDQTPAGFEADLAEALRYAPDHVSTYELSIESGTPFETAAARGQLERVEEDGALAMMEAAERLLGAAGLARYEISNFARPAAEAVHNRRYWQRNPVLGLGAGAFSTDPPSGDAPFGVRRSNLRGAAAYAARIEAGRAAEAAPGEVLARETARGEAVFLALRTRVGLAAAGFGDEFGGPPRDFYPADIDALVAEGLLLETDAGDLRLTPRGRELADTVFSRFV